MKNAKGFVKLGLAAVGLSLCAVYSPIAQAGDVKSGRATAYTEQVLYGFTGGADGAEPQGGVIKGAGGALYGTTALGGNLTACTIFGAGCGVVFKVEAGAEIVLHTFSGGSDGANPLAGLIRGSDGRLFGTTEIGGNTADCFGYGCGAVFQIDSSGNNTVLYAFTGGTDGELPGQTLLRSPTHEFYGTTEWGGSGTACGTGFPSGCGVVFKTNKRGKETVVYSFAGGTDGGHPSSQLIQDTQGNIYGTTSIGGNLNDCVNVSTGCGVIFKIDPNGTEAVLYTFTGGTDGSDPEGGLIADANGNLYGVTTNGGIAADCANDSVEGGCGVVFKVDPSGNETVLYSFTGGTDGGEPASGLVMDSANNLYGTTTSGGNTSDCTSSSFSSGCGVVFEVDTTGSETVLYTFTGGSDGAKPVGRLITDKKLNLYGATQSGGIVTDCYSPFGVSGCGVVFKLHR